MSEENDLKTQCRELLQSQNLLNHKFGIPKVPSGSEYDIILQHEMKFLNDYRQLNVKAKQLTILEETSNDNLDIQYERIKDANSIYKLHDLTINHETTDELEDTFESKENLVKYLDNMFEVRTLTFETTIATLSLLKAVYQKKGVTMRENSLLQFLKIRDDLAIKLLQLTQGPIKEKYKQLTLLIEHNSSMIKENKAKTQELLKKLGSTKSKQDKAFVAPKKGSENESNRKKYTKKITYAQKAKQQYTWNKLRNSILGELILALVVASGLNWAEDDKLRQIVLFCQDYDDEEEDEDGVFGALESIKM